MYVEINEEKLKHFIQSALVDRCYRCPLRSDKNNCKHYTAKTKEEFIYPCDKYLFEWLQDIKGGLFKEE